MLVAEQQNGELLVITKEVNADKLRILRQQQSFFCPQCRQPLQLKVGAIKIPHFAHHKNSTCEQAFSEGETFTHILGKQQLFHFFQQRNIHAQLEYYLPHLAQRPDLYVEHGAKKYAIEFQYSHIQPEMFHARTKGYHMARIEPIWLVQTPKSVVANGVQRLSVSHFHQLFVQNYKERRFLTSYDPKRESFFYITLLFHIHHNAYLTTVDRLDLSNQTFPFLIPKTLTYAKFHEVFTLYKEQMQHTLNAIFKYSKKGVQHLFLRYLYELRLGLMELPIFLYVPIRGSEAMNVICSGWQCALFYFAQQLSKCVWELKMTEVQLFFTCMKLPFNVQTVEVLRRYVRICRKLHITSIRTHIDERQLVLELYEQYIQVR